MDSRIPHSDILPIGHESQRALTRTWSRFMGHRGRYETASYTGLRGFVRASWERSLSARVRPELAVAPLRAR